MRQVSGLYHGRGWQVEVGDDAEADDVLMASMHESMHDRLQMTTLFGCTVALLKDHAARASDEAVAIQASRLQQAATRVHEEFATWMSVVPAGWSDRLHRVFPVYGRHLLRAERRVRDLRGPYVAMHAVQAIARTCMQPLGLTTILHNTPPTEISARQLAHTCRPDARLITLERALTEHGWGPVSAWTGDAQDMSPERFAEEGDPGWGDLNRAAYDWCRSLLEEAGSPTLPYDGHLPFVDALRGALGIRRTQTTSSSPMIALMSVESETLILDEPLPAFVHPVDTPMSELMAGGEDGQHLFLAIRPRQELLSQYHLTDPISLEAHAAVLRCQREDDTVELLDVTDIPPADLGSAGPVVVSIAMSSLADESVRHQWRSLLGHHQSTVLCDLRPSTNIAGWMNDAAMMLRYAIVGIETRVGTIRLLIFRMENGGDVSRLYLAPISRLYSTGFQQWLRETPSLRERVMEDESLGDLPLVRYSAAHILLEERLFTFTSGD